MHATEMTWKVSFVFKVKLPSVEIISDVHFLVKNVKLKFQNHVQLCTCCLEAKSSFAEIMSDFCYCCHRFKSHFL